MFDEHFCIFIQSMEEKWVLKSGARPNGDASAQTKYIFDAYFLEYVLSQEISRLRIPSKNSQEVVILVLVLSERAGRWTALPWLQDEQEKYTKKLLGNQLCNHLCSRDLGSLEKKHVT